MAKGDPTAGDERDNENRHGRNHPEGRGVRGPGVGLEQSKLGMIVGGHGVGSGERLRVEAEVLGNGSDESPIEYATGKLVPAFVFESFDQANGDTSGPRKRLDRNLPRLTLLPQTKPK